MEESTSVRLDLRAPLEFAAQSGLDPFGCAAGEGDAQELLFCFELDREQAGRIDPEAACFLGPELPLLILPAGLYLFVQRRRFLGRGECIALAIEQQKDGLWEKLRLESRLYIRRLFEDSSEVTQLFRPILNKG